MKEQTMGERGVMSREMEERESGGGLKKGHLGSVVICDPAVLLFTSRTCEGRRHRARAGNQTPRGARPCSAVSHSPSRYGDIPLKQDVRVSDF